MNPEVAIILSLKEPRKTNALFYASQDIMKDCGIYLRKEEFNRALQTLREEGIVLWDKPDGRTTRNSINQDMFNYAEITWNNLKSISSLDNNLNKHYDRISKFLENKEHKKKHNKRFKNTDLDLILNGISNEFLAQILFFLEAAVTIKPLNPDNAAAKHIQNRINSFHFLLEAARKLGKTEFNIVLDSIRLKIDEILKNSESFKFKARSSVN